MSRHEGCITTERSRRFKVSGNEWISAVVRDAQTEGEIIVLLDQGKVDISVKRNMHERARTILALPLDVITDAGLFREWMREQVQQADDAEAEMLLAEVEAKEKEQNEEGCKGCGAELADEDGGPVCVDCKRERREEV